MASHRAIEAVCRAVAGLLGDAFDAALFPSVDADFDVVDGDQLRAGIGPGAGVFLYRLTINGTRRHPDGRRTGTRRQLPKLPLDAHLLVVVAAADPGTKAALAGWVMRQLEDHPVLAAGLLNRGVPDRVFDVEEAVELAFEDVEHEELLRIWELLGAEGYDVLLLPYVARTALVESDVTVEQHPEVQERLVRYGVLAEVSP